MNFVKFCILCIAIGLVEAFVHKNPSGWSNSVQIPPKSALATSWSDAFILPHEVPFARALSVPILLYLANDPVEKTKRVFGVVSKLLRVEESSNVRKSSKEELLALVATVQPNGIGANEGQRQSINELNWWRRATHQANRHVVVLTVASGACFTPTIRHRVRLRDNWVLSSAMYSSSCAHRRGE